MSQAQEARSVTQLPPAMAVTWLNGMGSSLSTMPAALAPDRSRVISAATQPVPVAYGRVKLSACPGLIPGPHRAGTAQVVMPPGTTFQPWLASNCRAAAGLYGNGSPGAPLASR